MKILLPVLLALFCLGNSHAQTSGKTYGRVDVEIVKEKKNTAVKVAIRSAFPGGDSTWVSSMENSLVKSIETDKQVKKGIHFVAAQFVVGKDGNFSDIRLLDTSQTAPAQHVLRFLKKNSKWIPGEANGRSITVYGQVAVEITKTKKPEKIAVKVKPIWAFSRDTAWAQSVEDKLNHSIPADKRIRKGKHVVVVKFRVLTDGSLAEIRCVEDPGYGLYEEVRNVLREYERKEP